MLFVQVRPATFSADTFKNLTQRLGELVLANDPMLTSQLINVISTTINNPDADAFLSQDQRQKVSSN